MVGVDVGEITASENVAGGVEVTFTVDDPAIQLPTDVQAAIIPVSLLGERYIQLLPAYTGGPTLPENSTIGTERTAVPAEPDELLRSLQDYFGALDPGVVGRFVANTARLLEGNGQELGELIVQASELVQTLSGEAGRARGRSSSSSTVSQGPWPPARRGSSSSSDLQHRGHHPHREPGGPGGNDHRPQRRRGAAASVLVAHRRPLNQDVRALTRTGRTVYKNIDRLTETGRWAVRLFKAASNADRLQQGLAPAEQPWPAARRP